MKVALVHDWLTGLRGGERVLLNFLDLYPDADIYTLIHVPGATTKEIDLRVKQASFLNKIPGIEKNYRNFLPFFPNAVSNLKINDYDLVISTSHAGAKNIKTNSPHISYCFSPMRYIWDQAEHYLGSKRFLAQPLIQYLRAWDRKGSKGVTEFVGISNFIRARIRCFYKRDSEVIYPAVNTDWITPGKSEDYFIYAGALVQYKLPDLVVKAFNKLGLKLLVIGSGPMLNRLKAMSKPNIEFISGANDQQMAKLYAGARALIFPGIEDFGLVPVEVMAAGKPVITSNRGGSSETVVGWKYWRESAKWDKVTGVNIRQNNSLESLLEAIDVFLDNEGSFDPNVCCLRAKDFSVERFNNEWKQFVVQYVKTKK